MAGDPPLISVEGVSKKYCTDLARSLRYGARDILSELTLRRDAIAGELRPGEFWALSDISFELRPGESLGIVGRNGAGKSTLLRLLAGVTRPDTGRIAIRGRVGALLSLGAGFDPVLTGRENILIEGTALGLSRRRLRDLIDGIVEFSELGGFIDSPVHTYSDGMRMRLGFSVATSLQTDVLLLDEVLMVGDVNFRRKSVQHIKHFIAEGGAVVFVSHEVWLVQAICTEAMHLSGSRVVAHGDVLETINHYFVELEAAAGEAAQPMAASPVVIDSDAALPATTPGAESAAAEGIEPVEGAEAATGGPGTDESAAPSFVRFDDVTIGSLDHDEIITGDRVEITAAYEAEAAFERVFWGFLIWSADRMVCITAQGTDFDMEPFPLEVGRGELRGVIEHMPLMGGMFVLGVAIVDDVTRMPIALFGWDDQGLLFTVKSPETPKTVVLKTAGPMLDLAVSWDEITPRIVARRESAS